MEAQKQNSFSNSENKENLEEKAIQLKEALPVVSDKKDILSGIEALEKTGDYMGAAILARRQGDKDRALANYQKAAEKYYELIHSKERLFGDEINFPKKHKARIGEYEAIVKLHTVFSNENELIPYVKLKIKGPGIKAYYGYRYSPLAPFLDFHYINYGEHPFTFSKSDEVMKKLKMEMGRRCKRKINQDFLEQLVKEALIPYEPRSY